MFSTLIFLFPTDAPMNEHPQTMDEKIAKYNPLAKIGLILPVLET